MYAEYMGSKHSCTPVKILFLLEIALILFYIWSILSAVRMSPHVVQFRKTSKKGKKGKKVKGGKRATLHHAANTGDPKKMLKLIKRGADINALDLSGHTALHMLVEYGDIELVKLLIKEGADLEIPDKESFTALHIAAAVGLEDMLKVLLDAHAEINAKNEEGATPLHVAVRGSHVGCVKYLCRKGANVNATLIDGKTPLHLALVTPNECIEALVEGIADIYAKDSLGISPLDIAMEYGLEVMGKLLPNNGRFYSPDGTTPLHIAARSVNLECLNYFIKEGCDINLPTKSGDTPLHFTCSMDTTINSVLRVPVRLMQYPNIEVLVKAGANLNKKNHKNLAPIHVSVLSNDLLSLQYLCKFGADINLRGGEKKSTPLHFACEKGYFEIIIFLIEHGGDKNSVDKEKNTPLMLAARNSHYECIKYLLENNAFLWSLN